MNLFVDTSVWSLALRRDGSTELPAIALLKEFLLSGKTIVTTGIVIQELLQGFSGPKDRQRIIDRFQALPLLQPGRHTYIAAAELRNACRRSGVPLGTIDALIAQLCIEHDLALLTTDKDFAHAAKHVPLKLAT
ncbi:MAG: PIN domain-containing protein [Thermomonas sp.]|uniref:type II toxin-antitoxin system VapC family toxin n=1 Tax=Thermomonas sp. TaxID=1971895 RepID=UPI0039E4B695